MVHYVIEYVDRGDVIYYIEDSDEEEPGYHINNFNR
jgi:hypothetical protein